MVPITDINDNDAVTAEALHTEAHTWRLLTHHLGIDLRRRMITLARHGLLPLDTACDILHAAGLPPLPRQWTVRADFDLTRPSSQTTDDRTDDAVRDALDQAIRAALGPSATVEYPQRHATPPPDTPTDNGDTTCREIREHPVVTALVRAEDRDQAWERMVAALRAAVASLPDTRAGLDRPDVAYIDPDPHDPQELHELNADTDAPYEPFTLPAACVGRRLTLSEARTARRLARQAWQQRVRDIRAALINAAVHGDIDPRPGQHEAYRLVNELLTDVGLAGLPRAHQYEVTATIPFTVTADDPKAARLAAYRLVRDASATHAQYGLPITIASTFRQPIIIADRTPATDGPAYRVTWYETYLVCLRGIRSTPLAEQVIRLQLSVLADTLPGRTPITLNTTHLGERVDHRLDPARD